MTVALLALFATTTMGGLLHGLTAARKGKLRAQAGAWVQAELDYLRVQGYPNLEDDVIAGSRTLTQTSGYTTYGDLTEPQIPRGFDRAVVRVEDISGLPLRKLTVSIYETPTSPPYTILVTYVSNFNYPTGP